MLRIGILLLLAGICYGEFNIFAGNDLDFSSLTREKKDFVDSPTTQKNGTLDIPEIACFAEITCVLGGDAREDILKCYEDTDHDTSLFEEYSEKLCEKDPQTQRYDLTRSLRKVFNRCFYAIRKDKQCAEEDLDNVQCIYDYITEIYKKNGTLCNEEKYED